MDTSVAPGTHCYHCLQCLRADFAREMGRWDEAEQGLQLLLRMDADQPRSLAVHHANLCQVAYERGDRDALSAWARSGEQLARQTARDDCLAECLAWRAFVTMASDAVDAERLAGEAVAAAQRAAGAPHSDFFDVLCRYYEGVGALDRALDARFTQLKELADTGRLARELHCRAEICRLLAALGKSARNQIAAARKVARGLQRPEPTLALFDRLDREGSRA
jgi:hypothetical protein